MFQVHFSSPRHFSFSPTTKSPSSSTEISRPSLDTKDRYTAPAPRLARQPELRFSYTANICRDVLEELNQGEVLIRGTDLRFPVYVPHGDADHMRTLFYSRECHFDFVEIGSYRHIRPILIRRQDYQRLLRHNGPAVLQFNFPQGIHLN